MELNFRKLWTVLGVACLSANLAAAPASSSNASSSSSQMSTGDQSMMASGLMYAGPMLGEDSTGISLGADYILWQVVQEGLETVGNNYWVDGVGTSSVTRGTTSYPKFKLLNGFKVHGQVTISECDDVDLFLQYIWLQRTTGTNTGTGGANTFSFFWVDPNDMSVVTADNATAWSSSFRTSYNVLDLEMGRLTSLAKDSFSIRPFWGIRGVWNTHTWIPSYTGQLNQSLATVNTLNVYQNTSGAGVRAGFNLGWQFFANSEYFGGLKIIGLSALSGVYGRTYVDHLATNAPSAPNSYGTTFSYTRASINRMVPIVDLSIGLSWNMSFGGERDNDYNVEIHALWDTQSWIGYGRQCTAAWLNRACYNMTVQGFTIGAQVAF
jgi:hypothetical protein